VMEDASSIFLDLPFPGRRLLSWSVGIWAVAFFFPALIFNTELFPVWLDILRDCLLDLALVLYFIGYWKAVIGKGYSRILFLAAFAPVIGIIIIFFIPSLINTSPLPVE